MIAWLIADRIGLRNAGLLLLGVAAACLIAALALSWSAVQRWRAASALQAWNQAVLSGRDDEAREDADRAASIRPDDAAAALAATDLTKAESADRLGVVAVRCARRDRDTVEKASSLSQALRGKGGNGAEGIDGALLTVVADLSRDDGGPASWPHGSDAPDPAIARAAAERVARAAWRAGDAAAVREAFGRLLLLEPNRRDAALLVAAVAALDPTTPRERLVSYVTRLGDHAAAAALMRACMRLAPDRAALFDPLIPSDQRSPDEARLALMRSTEPLKILASKAESQNDQAVTEAIAWRCLGAGELDLAQRLSTHLTEPAKTRVATALATARGDVLALAALQPDRADLKPRVTEPWPNHAKKMSFHIATGSGLVPSATPSITMGGVPVPATSIQRWDSLLLVQRTADIEEAVDIRIGNTLVWTGRVGP